MIYADEYDMLNAWQRAMVNREARNACLEDQTYRALERMRELSTMEVAEAADTIINHMYQEALDAVLMDVDFMESITTDEETRYMTKGNSRAY